MQVWQEILKTALMGTGRQGLALTASGDAVNSLLARLEGEDREKALLTAVGVVSVWKRAGFVAVKNLQSQLLPCEAEDQPACSQGAAQDLALMLKGEFEKALPEWLSAIATTELRVPEEHLPDLLEAGFRSAALRSLILPVLGKRGRWLAWINPDWSYGAGESLDEDTWETGKREQRVAFLCQMREKDPARARQLLADTWKGEASTDRAALLESFSVGLSMEDEPFLESLLDGRQQKVRRTAAELLARLPESRLYQRMVARLLPILSLKRGLLGGERIETNPPEECDEAMIRDGIQQTPSDSMGKRAWWLFEMVRLMPLEFWEKLWSKTPGEIVLTGARSDWKDALLSGWRDVAQRSQDPEWSEALARWWCFAEENIKPPGANALHLIQYILPAKLEKMALDTFSKEKSPIHDQHPALWILREHRHRWSDNLSLTVIDSFRKRIAKGEERDRFSWEARSSLKGFALYISPGLADRLAAGWPDQSDDWPRWEQNVDEFLSLLRFRREMLGKIASGGSFLF